MWCLACFINFRVRITNLRDDQLLLTGSVYINNLLLLRKTLSFIQHSDSKPWRNLCLFILVVIKKSVSFCNVSRRFSLKSKWLETNCLYILLLWEFFFLRQTSTVLKQFLPKILVRRNPKISISLTILGF